MHNNTDEDKIAYLIVSEPGGVDGRDSADKGGHIHTATFDKTTAEALHKKLGPGWYRIDTKIVVGVAKSRETAIKKLSALDRLLILGEKITTTRRAVRERDHSEGNRG
jgi:hypothetical protein